MSISIIHTKSSCSFIISYVNLKRNKIFILLRSFGPNKWPTCGTSEPLRYNLRPSSAAVARARSQQNTLFCFVYFNS